MQALFWMSGALISTCLMAISARQLSGGISIFQIFLIRNIIGLIAVTLIIACARKRSVFKTRKLKLHLGRNIFHFLGLYGWFLGIGVLPLAHVFALEFTTPLWTLIAASLFLKESLTARKSVAILLGSIGVYLILNPGSEILNPASLYVIGAAIFISLGHILTKALTTTDHPMTMLFYMCVIQLPIALLGGFSSFLFPTTIQWVWLALIGIAALTAHFCIAKAMEKADASVVVTLDFLRLPLIAAIGVLMYSENIEPMLLIGAGLMLIGNLVNTCQSKLKN